MEYSLKNAKSLLTWLISLAYAGLFFPIRISNFSLTTLIVFCALSVIGRPRQIVEIITESTFAKIVLAMYLLLMIGLLYSTDIKTGVFILEKKIFFLLAPLFVLPAIRAYYKEGNDLIFRKIGYITVLSSLVLLVVGAYRRLILNDDLAFAYLPGSEFEGFTSIHYVYYAMYFGVGSLMLMDSLFEDAVAKRFGVLMLAILFAYSLGIMILVASKTGIVIFVIASIFLLYQKVASRFVFGSLIIFLLISGFILLYFNDATRSRFQGLSEDLAILKEDTLVTEFEATGVNMRLLFWKIQLVNAWNDNLMFTGTGTGDIQHYIDELYASPKYQIYGFVGWDSHNQWVYTFLQTGLPGLLLLAVLYWLYFRRGFRRKDNNLVTFLIITLGFSFTESILELNKGIVFFSLMFSLLEGSYQANRMKGDVINGAHTASRPNRQTSFD